MRVQATEVATEDRRNTLQWMQDTLSASTEDWPDTSSRRNLSIGSSGNSDLMFGGYSSPYSMLTSSSPAKKRRRLEHGNGKSTTSSNLGRKTRRKPYDPRLESVNLHHEIVTDEYSHKSWKACVRRPKNLDEILYTMNQRQKSIQSCLQDYTGDSKGSMSCRRRSQLRPH